MPFQGEDRALKRASQKNRPAVDPDPAIPHLDPAHAEAVHLPVGATGAPELELQLVNTGIEFIPGQGGGVEWKAQFNRVGSGLKDRETGFALVRHLMWYSFAPHFGLQVGGLGVIAQVFDLQVNIDTAAGCIGENAGFGDEYPGLCFQIHRAYDAVPVALGMV